MCLEHAAMVAAHDTHIEKGHRHEIVTLVERCLIATWSGGRGTLRRAVISCTSDTVGPVAAGESARRLKESIMKLGNTSGFTLIELTIVLAGLVLVTILLPAVQSSGNARTACGLEVSQCEMNVGGGH